ncbi:MULTISPECIES: substrate-binding domain-containing protein [unclassified Novosphingobium]|uniref:substrate-binding domain-containing protein n=1 Tax=unclassified Novosphingobium TaxID=2644732 RepID=UPI000AB0942A|nr:MULTISPECIES: substrate-binding domain-containing protein [unclassified Novosphingobium]MDR6706607.1 molybdate transport system substrate-binding protein [Novosphingobium sp. 1748]
MHRLMNSDARTGAGEPASRLRRGVVLGLVLAPLLAACHNPTARAPSAVPVAANELHVLTSGGFNAAFDVLAAQYTAQTGTRIAIGHGPSMGATANAIPARLARGEDADVVILARSALDALTAQGRITQGTSVDLALSKIAVAVREGAPAPDISTPQALRQTLIAAPSVAWSDSASGVYIQTTMLDRLGVADIVRPKGRMIPATPVGEIVARGEAQIGFQQLSELKPVKGIRIIGLVPDELQKVTAFSGGVVASSPRQQAARSLLDFLSSSKAEAAIRASGMEPASQKVTP